MREAGIELRALGAAEVRRAGERIALQPKRAALLAYLVTGRPRGPQRREILASLFWPETDDRLARNALSQALHGLRRALDPHVVRTDGREVVGIAPGSVQCDALAFEDELDGGRPRAALDHFRGDFLEGLHVSGAIGFERWLEVERARLRRRAKDAARALADDAEAAGNPVAAVRWLQRGLEISPSDETDARRLIALLDGLGDRAGALHTYDELERHLRTQYDATPAPETRALVARIRQRAEAAPALDVAREPPAHRSRLAVLPLQNLTGDPDQEYFADGMTETLIAELARSTHLPVISRQSVLAFKGSDRPLSEIVRRLGVDLVIEGSVLRVGERVRISAQLVRAEPEAHLWADSFDGTVADLLGLQREVARAVARHVGRLLPVTPEARRGSAGTVDFRAYDAFLRGIIAFPYITPDTFAETLGRFQQATELDQSFAEAHAWIAFLWMNAAYVGLASFPEARDRALPAAERAVRMAPGLGSVHAIYAAALQAFVRDWDAVDEAFRTAAELGGGDSRSWGAHGLFLGSMGRFDEAMQRVEEYIRLDPLGAPFSFLRGWLLFRARRYEEALEQLRWVASEWPEYAWTHAFLAASHLFAGWPARAVETCREALARGPRIPTVAAYLAATLARAGEVEEARGLVARLEEAGRVGYVDPCPLAVAYAGLGDHERALDALGRVVHEGSVQSWVLSVEVFFDPLREHPRFEEARKALGLPRLERT